METDCCDVVMHFAALGKIRNRREESLQQVFTAVLFVLDEAGESLFHVGKGSDQFANVLVFG